MDPHVRVLLAVGLIWAGGTMVWALHQTHLGGCSPLFVEALRTWARDLAFLGLCSHILNEAITSLTGKSSHTLWKVQILPESSCGVCCSAMPAVFVCVRYLWGYESRCVSLDVQPSGWHHFEGAWLELSRAVLCCTSGWTRREGFFIWDLKSF